MPLYHVLAILEFIFLFFFYRSIFNFTLPLALGVAIVGINIYNSLFIQCYLEFNSIAWSINTIFLMAFGLLYLYQLYRESESSLPILTRHSLFIINSGFLLYFAGSLFTYLLGANILSKEAIGFFHNGWIIQCFANIIRNTLVGYGLWIARK